jgi:hypothetical protein
MTASVVPPTALKKNTAAVNKQTTSSKSSARINKLPSAHSVSVAGKIGAVALGTFALATGAGELALAGGALYLAFNRMGNNDTSNTSAETVVNTPGSFPDPKFEYNLPPHAWSLPVRPIDVQGGEIAENGKLTGVPNIYSRANDAGREVHRSRRGVIWFWDNGDKISSVDASGKVTTAKQKQAEADKANKTKNSQAGQNSHAYGFQFLWNPEQITSSIARNMDVTPSSADRFRSVAGAFPGQESYTFTIVLDRVNDFACIKSLAGAKKSARTSYPIFPKEIIDYYKYSLYQVGESKIREQLYNLSRYGTMADLEYLFKALNGNGAGQGGSQTEWTTLLKKPTANIGFLSPTLLAFRFGSDALEGPSFVGWITNLSINHTFFTEDMIPLRTTVSFSCDAFAGSTVV